MTRPSRAAVAFLLAALAALGACTDGTTAAGDAVADPEPVTTTTARPTSFTFSTRTLTFVDPDRPTVGPDGVELAPDRTLVTDLYVPDGSGPFPVIVFAHGAWGHARKFTELASVWAEAGYLVAVPTFPLTNDEADVVTLGDVVNQPADVSFVLTEVLAEVEAADPQYVGVAGLSLGGATTYGVAYNSCCRDERIDAVIICSGARIPYDGEYAFSGVPFMVLHGTADPLIPFSEGEAAYAGYESAPKYFVTLDGGGHAQPYEDSPSDHDEIVEAVTTQFWNAYLLGDDEAAARIADAGTAPGLASVESEP